MSPRGGQPLRGRGGEESRGGTGLPQPQLRGWDSSPPRAQVTDLDARRVLSPHLLSGQRQGPWQSRRALGPVSAARSLGKETTRGGRGRHGPSLSRGRSRGPAIFTYGEKQCRSEPGKQLARYREPKILPIIMVLKHTREVDPPAQQGPRDGAGTGEAKHVGPRVPWSHRAAVRHAPSGPPQAWSQPHRQPRRLLIPAHPWKHAPL